MEKSDELIAVLSLALINGVDKDPDNASGATIQDQLLESRLKVILIPD
jgi:hypothetical protein